MILECQIGLKEKPEGLAKFLDNRGFRVISASDMGVQYQHEETSMEVWHSFKASRGEPDWGRFDWITPIVGTLSLSAQKQDYFLFTVVRDNILDHYDALCYDAKQDRFYGRS